MNKTKLGMLGAVSALAALPMGAQAAATQPAVAPAQSFSELLQPIPNAVQRLDASNRELAGGVRLLQADHHHHHGHHSAAWWRNYYRQLAWQRHHQHNHGHNNNHNNYNNNYNNNNNNHNHNHNDHNHY